GGDFGAARSANAPRLLQYAYRPLTLGVYARCDVIIAARCEEAGVTGIGGFVIASGHFDGQAFLVGQRQPLERFVPPASELQPRSTVALVAMVVLGELLGADVAGCQATPPDLADAVSHDFFQMSLQYQAVGTERCGVQLRDCGLEFFPVLDEKLTPARRSLHRLKAERTSFL